MPNINTIHNTPLQAGIYLSQFSSSVRQLDKQQNQCCLAAARHGADITTMYCDFPARRDTFEPGMRQALADLENGMINALVCTDTSHLSRNPKMLQFILQKISSARGCLIFAGPLSAPYAYGTQW